MKTLKLIALTLILAFEVSEGLRCWKCDNAKNDKDCKKRGRIQTCNSNENICFTETRIITKNVKTITRRCKQDVACNNNHIQNPRAAWMPSQCNERQGSVCRCCCDYNECNANENTQCSIGKTKAGQPTRKPTTSFPIPNDEVEQFFSPPNKCESVNYLENGKTKCYRNFRKTTSICYYSCSEGYNLEGNKRSVCRVRSNRKIMDHTVPLCMPEAPPVDYFKDSEDFMIADSSCVEPKTPFNGNKFCLPESNELGTMCEYGCNEGYVLEGSKLIACMIDPIFGNFSWSDNYPTCKPQCKVLKAPVNGEIECFDANGVRGIGSYCKSTCNSGYKLKGEAETTCVLNKNGFHGYNNAVPTCEKIKRCSEPETSANVNMECTSDLYEEGSGCVFTCDEGFVVDGPRTIMCSSENKFGVPSWTGNTPFCRPQCEVLKAPENGDLACFDVNGVRGIGTICATQCDLGYVLKGQPKTTCVVKENGVHGYNNALPICEKKLYCMEPETAPGMQVECSSNLYEEGTTCTFSCGDRFFLDGSKTVTCITEDKFELPIWSADSPTCQPQCEVLKAPKNGKVNCIDTEGVRGLGTFCAIECDPGYSRKGNALTTCVMNENGVHNYNNALPRCEKIQYCPEPETSPNVKIECSSKLYEKGSSCIYSCDEGYVLDGDETTYCKFNKAFKLVNWNKKSPICRKQCKVLQAPENGNLNCDKESQLRGIGFSCLSKCNEGYSLTGKARTTCFINKDGELEYDNDLPKCEKNKCPAPQVLRRVNRVCTDDNYHGSKCKFTCEQNLYTPNPGDAMENYCQNNGTWSSPEPCCRLPCPPHTIMDLVVVLDSSSSVRRKNWEKTIVFVSKVLSNLIINTTYSQVFVIRYNRFVDEENQVFLNNNENETEIYNALKTIPYNGRGTFTGRALNYVRNDLLKRPQLRKNVTDVVLLLTDGRASDSVKEISQKLRDDGVELYAIGVGKSNPEELLEITGSETKYWSHMKNFDDLDVDTATQIGQQICNSSCA